MCSKAAIRINGLSKRYFVYSKPADRLKQMLLPRVQRFFGRVPSKYCQEVCALNGISLEIGKGETVGVVGRNGSGKSTLLQIICGVLQGTSGSVEVEGRVAALLELGAGYNPDFSGRENVYLNGAILGLSPREMDEQFDAIAGFADIGRFIDLPVKTYSTGMYVRLAFATAINVNPDILIVDEALAVGDEAFQRKCFARIEQIKAAGATILFVSHGAQTIVELCDRAILIDDGNLLLDGHPKWVTSQYQRLLYSPPKEQPAVRAAIASDEVPSNEQKRMGSEARAIGFDDLESFNPAMVSQSTLVYVENGARITDVRLLNGSGQQVNVLMHGRVYSFRYLCRFETTNPVACFNMLLKTKEGLELFAQASHRSPETLAIRSGDTVEVTFRFRCLLMPGTYFGNAGVSGVGCTLHRIVDAVVFMVAPYTPTRTVMRYVNLALDDTVDNLYDVEIRKVREVAAGLLAEAK